MAAADREYVADLERAGRLLDTLDRMDLQTRTLAMHESAQARRLLQVLCAMEPPYGHEPTRIRRGTRGMVPRRASKGQVPIPAAAHAKRPWYRLSASGGPSRRGDAHAGLAAVQIQTWWKGCGVRREPPVRLQRGARAHGDAVSEGPVLRETFGPPAALEPHECLAHTGRDAAAAHEHTGRGSQSPRALLGVLCVVAGLQGWCWTWQRAQDEAAQRRAAARRQAAATTIQSVVRMFLQQRRNSARHRAATQVQRVIKGYQCRRRALYRKLCARVIQRRVRRFLDPEECERCCRQKILQSELRDRRALTAAVRRRSLGMAALKAPLSASRREGAQGAEGCPAGTTSHSPSPMVELFCASEQARRHVVTLLQQRWVQEQEALARGQSVSEQAVAWKALVSRARPPGLRPQSTVIRRGPRGGGYGRGGRALCSGTSGAPGAARRIVLVQAFCASRLASDFVCAVRDQRLRLQEYEARLRGRVQDMEATVREALGPRCVAKLAGTRVLHLQEQRVRVQEHEAEMRGQVEHCEQTVWKALRFHMGPAPKSRAHLRGVATPTDKLLPAQRFWRQIRGPDAVGDSRALVKDFDAGATETPPRVSLPSLSASGSKVNTVRSLQSFGNLPWNVHRALSDDPTLALLDLTDWDLDAAALQTLALALAGNTHLKVIILDRTAIEDGPFQMLLEVVGNSRALCTLSARANRLTERTAAYVLQLLESDVVLPLLFLEGNQISDSVLDQIQRAQTRRA